jgi:ABC-type polysaccharide/polyol phosphate export permease
VWRWAQLLWARRELVGALAERDVRLRYKQAVIGVAWTVLQPALAVGLFALVTRHGLGVETGGVAYVPFALAGLAVWFFVARGVEGAAESLAGNRSFVTRAAFPRLAAPVAAVGAAVVDLALGLVLLLVVCVAAGVDGPSWALLTLPLWLAAAVAVALAVGIGLCAANVLYRDVRYALPFLLQTWFFASPVVFGSGVLGGAARWVWALNPLVGVIDGVRWAVLAGPAPPTADLASVAGLVLAAVAALAFFGRTERVFGDRV